MQKKYLIFQFHQPVLHVWKCWLKLLETKFIACSWNFVQTGNISTIQYNTHEIRFLHYAKTVLMWASTKPLNLSEALSLWSFTSQTCKAIFQGVQVAQLLVYRRGFYFSNLFVTVCLPCGCSSGAEGWPWKTCWCALGQCRRWCCRSPFSWSLSGRS